MNELVTLEQAKARLRLPAIVDEEADLQSLLDAAHGILEDHVKQRISGADDWELEVDAWTDETAPQLMIQAILLQFGAMVRFRGDDEPGTKIGYDENGLAIGVAGYLRRLKDPAIA
jgi:hypothetical protein